MVQSISTLFRLCHACDRSRSELLTGKQSSDTEFSWVTLVQSVNQSGGILRFVNTPPHSPNTAFLSKTGLGRALSHKAVHSGSQAEMWADPPHRRFFLLSVLYRSLFWGQVELHAEAGTATQRRRGPYVYHAGILPGTAFMAVCPGRDRRPYHNPDDMKSTA